MICPKCGATSHKVIFSILTSTQMKTRKIECLGCSTKFTTVEIILGEINGHKTGAYYTAKRAERDGYIFSFLDHDKS